ncbi:MAG: hypothetical protein JXR22_14115 [Prolixibacteraceae bacterium]|nr:hypothetical protein [Prolixibacteraceae bacterium]
MKKLLFVLFSLLVFITACDEEPIVPSKNTLKAHAGIDLQVEVNQLLVLDGSNSKDEASQDFEYHWSIKSHPENSNALLSEETSVSPKFRSATVGTYVVELKISNDVYSDSDELNVVVFEATNPPVNQPQIINQDIQYDRTLPNLYEDPSIPDYLVTEDVCVSALLTIEPSVSIAFEADKAMYVEYEGTLRAEGWIGKEVVFTGKEKTPGYWKGLIIHSPSEQNLLKHAIVEYGGSNRANGMEAAANLALAGESKAKLTVLSSTLQHSKSYGLVLESGSAFSVPVNDLVLKNNQRPALIPASQMTVSLGLVYDNEWNVIDVTGDLVYAQNEILWHRAIDNSTPAVTVPYRVMGKVVVNSGLRILPGTHFMFDVNAELMIGHNGYLIAVGTGVDPIRFHGAVPNETGYWKGIGIHSSHALNELKYVEVYGAGSQAMEGFDQAAAIILDGESQATVSIKYSKIGRSGGYGLFVENKAQLSAFNFNKLGYNTHAAMALPVNEVAKANQMLSLEFVGNGHNGIEILGSVLLEPNKQETVWPALSFGATYLVSSDLSIQTGLKLMPGVVLKFAEGKGLKVSGIGYLNAQGNDDLKVVFTGKSESKGYWNGLHFQSNSDANILHNAVIEFAGMERQTGKPSASIYVGENYVSKLHIARSKIAHGKGYGIALATNLGTINSDFESLNEFDDLSLGKIYQNTSW